MRICQMELREGSQYKTLKNGETVEYLGDLLVLSRVNANYRIPDYISPQEEVEEVSDWCVDEVCPTCGNQVVQFPESNLYNFKCGCGWAGNAQP